MTATSRSYLVQQLAAFATTHRSTGIPDEFREDIVGRIIDVLGNTLAGSATDVSAITASVLQAQSGVEQAVAIGLPGRFPRANAALHNGTLAHCLDFDDTHLPSVVHPSASVIPATLAVAESVDSAPASIFTAAAVGIEITNRLGMAGYDAGIGNSVFFERGLHATSICGTLGAAASAALLLGGDTDCVAHAMAIAASMGAGLLEANRNGGTVKRVHCGWAAHSGVMAAELALQGLTGPPTVLEGRFGFLQAHCADRVDLTQLTARLGEHWTLPDVGFKPYPCNIYTHAGIDAALQLRERGMGPDDIEQVTIGVAAPTLRTIGEPADRKAKPATGYEGLFSGPYTFAAALCGGGGLGVYLDDFTDEAVADPVRLAVAKRVHMVANDACSRVFPKRIPSVISVRTRDGEAFDIHIETNRGIGGRRLSLDELLTKFKLNAGRRLPEATVIDLLALVHRLENISVRDLMAAVAG